MNGTHFNPYRSGESISSRGMTTRQSNSNTNSSSLNSRIQGTATSAFSSSTPPRQSQTNQARAVLHFDALRRALPYDEARFKETGDTLAPLEFKIKHHDEVMRIINSKARQGIFLPLSFMHYVISKFSNERLGTLNEAIELFELIKQKHSIKVRDITLPETIKLYSEMMWVYLKRKDVTPKNHEERILALYHECPAMETRDALLKYHIILENFETVLKLYEEWPQGIPKGGYTFRYYLDAIKGSSKITSKEDIRKEQDKLIEANPQIMEDVTFFCDFLSNNYNEVDNEEG